MSDLHELLANLHNKLATKLLARIQDGDATAADLSVARQFLKDNGIDSVAAPGAPITKLADVLPFDQDDPIGEAQ
jgi:hypothetical protein